MHAPRELASGAEYSTTAAAAAAAATTTVKKHVSCGEWGSGGEGTRRAPRASGNFPGFLRREREVKIGPNGMEKETTQSELTRPRGHAGAMKENENTGEGREGEGARWFAFAYAHAHPRRLCLSP